MARNGFPEPRIEILPALLDQKFILSNLLELYSHDFSDFLDIEVGSDGRFGYRDLDLYWSDPHRWPFLIHVDTKLAGFFLVQSVPQDEGVVWDLAEFFVMRQFRRRAIGTRAALAGLARFPGRWQVRVMRANLPACMFWTHTVRVFAEDTARLSFATAHGRDWMVHSFNSPPGG